MKLRDVIFAGSLALLAFFALSPAVSAGESQEISTAGSATDQGATTVIFTDDDHAATIGTCVCSADLYNLWTDTAQCVSG